MPSQTALVLGDLVFDPSSSTLDVPDKMPWGGAQRIGVHQLPGGVRIVDAMGPDDLDITWSGMFFGPGATEKGRYLDYLRKRGGPVTLSWDAFQYTVIVERFEGDFERFYQVPYKVSCKVIEDLTQPVGIAMQNSVDDLVRADMTNVLSVAQALGMTVTGALPGPFSTTLGAVIALASDVTG
jgi:hypothetical protein